jgi:hypothetical protein
MMKFPKDVIGLIAFVLVAFIAHFAFKSLTQILDRRTNVNLENNGFHLRANFPVDTGTNGRVIPNILRSLPINQIPIRPRRPLR